MRIQLLVVCCVLQSLHGFPDISLNSNNSDVSTPSLVGLSLASIIADGETAEVGKFPYQCSLQISTQPWCGCAILDSNFVLTASHCIVGYAAQNVRIMVGSNELKSGGTYYDVEQLIPHEHYNNPHYAYDIALVKVKGPIEFNEKVGPIQLEDQELPDGAEVQLTGWGHIKEGYIPNKLQYLKLTILGLERCKKERIGKYVHHHNICTNVIRGNGACEGDSGSPLVRDNKVVGVVDFGPRCGEGVPDVYAKVSFFKEWITNHTTISN